jgi:hypothetical protein
MPLSPIQLNSLENSAAGRALAAVGDISGALDDFTDFTVSLVENVFKVVIDSTLDQLEAYAELVASVSGSLADYEARMLGNSAGQEQKALDFINEVLIPQFSTSNTPLLTLENIRAHGNKSITFDPAKVSALRTLLSGIQATVAVTELPSKPAAQVDDPDYAQPTAPPNDAPVLFDAVLSVNDVTNPTTWTIDASHMHRFALAKLKKEVKASYDKLVVVLKLGMQKVVITDGEIATSLTFHTDSTDSDSLDSTNVETESDVRSRGFTASLRGGGSRSRSGPLSGSIISRSLGGSISASGGASRVRSKLKVNVVNEKKVAVTNLSVDISGRVKIRFRTDAFPSYDATNPPAPASA